MDLSKTLIKEFAKSMTPTKEENTEGSQIRGTIVIKSDGKYVQLDGAPEGILTPISEGIDESDGDSFIDGDRVLVLIKDHQVIFSKNLSITSRSAEEAKDSAAEASRAAEVAYEKANTAAQSADRALTAAESAEEAATSAQTSANQALSDAADAAEAAQTAQTSATQALSDAANAAEAAQTAQTDAATAKSSAMQALSDAATAKASATQAISDAASANTAANNAGRAASVAQAAAEAAQGEITEQKQYFWHDSEGAHILSNDDDYRMDLTGSGLEITNADGDSVAEFGVNGSRIGNENGLRFEQTSTGLKAYNSSGQQYFELSNTSMKFGTGNFSVAKQSDLNTVDAKAQSVVDRADAGEFTSTVILIDSSRGTAFRNKDVNTVLRVTVQYGNQNITNFTDLQRVFGTGVYLQWYYQGLEEETRHVISSSDSRLSEHGFIFTISPEDVDTKCVFFCELNY